MRSEKYPKKDSGGFDCDCEVRSVIPESARLKLNIKSSQRYILRNKASIIMTTFVDITLSLSVL